MKKLFALLIPVLVLLSLGFVLADGGIMPPALYYKSVFAPEQKAAIFWDGSTEQMILSTKIISSELTNMAWVVPIQSSSIPIVKRGDSSIFFDLSDLFNPPSNYREKQSMPGLGAANTGAGVNVIQTLKIDMYDLTILKATSSNSLLDWLNDNNFYFPVEKENVLEYYINTGDYYFVANKINLVGESSGATAGENETKCADEIQITPYTYTYSGADAKEVLKRIDADFNYLFQNSEDCNTADFNLVKALVELKLGVATPLEFTFNPKKPFYPMIISSVNDNFTNAEIYFFGENCVDDSSKLLMFENAVLNSTVAEKYGFSKSKCVSFLDYSGSTSVLNMDSFFTEKPFLPEYSPDYTLPEDAMKEVFGILFEILLIVILAVSIFLIAVLPGLVIGILTAYFAKKKKKPLEKNPTDKVHAIGIIVLACIIALPVLLLILLTITEINTEAIFALVLLCGLYGVFQVIGFLLGYFFMKKKNWGILVAGSILLIIIFAIIEVLVYVGGAFFWI
ncbi:MAG: DUF2330 domain-containing protein [Candidatus Diapherotrites archaeon]|nr:DUF2330 domain-containing protein [Candidatus Diapherotrites archaeon]